MEEKILLYHGTNVVVEKPEVRVVGYNKDFGFGAFQASNTSDTVLHRPCSCHPYI